MGIKKLKQHLVKTSYKGTLCKDVRKCDKVPQDVVDLLRSFMEGKQKATEEKQNKKDKMIRNVNVYENNDGVGIQIPKKKKGPMNAFVASIDVDFRPRAPTSNENKKALENIHGYIADFFYENSISFNCARSDSYSKMMQAIVQYNDPSSKSFILQIIFYNTRTVFLKSIDGSAHIHDAKLIYKILKDVIEEVEEKNVIQAGRLGKRGAQACVKTIALVPDDARDDIVLGTAITYGVLEDAEDGFDDPPLTRTSRTNTTSHCLQEGHQAHNRHTCHLQDSSDDDDYDVDKNYDVGDGDDDGIDSGSDEDI
ncbi:hypothetical protein GIB67_024056 [Kingdonia uniflora]|uniref:DUF659 domain-containing protein n=1 Tax=Kingdonia uniflora TaxID=39325 RepID=A0A7J7LB53_9MAGN|nr:hypothetical protein GIB67_024056 [Kingdonia uniflora]